MAIAHAIIKCYFAINKPVVFIKIACLLFLVLLMLKAHTAIHKNSGRVIWVVSMLLRYSSCPTDLVEIACYRAIIAIWPLPYLPIAIACYNYMLSCYSPLSCTELCAKGRGMK